MVGFFILTAIWLLGFFVKGFLGTLFLMFLWAAAGGILLFIYDTPVLWTSPQELRMWNRSADRERWENALVTVGTRESFFRYSVILNTCVFFLLYLAAGIFAALKESGALDSAPSASLGYTVLYVGSLPLYFLPRLWALAGKLRFYRKLRRRCQEDGFRLHGDLRRFLFGEKDGGLSPLTVETPTCTFRIYAIGQSGSPKRYLFREGKGCLSVPLTPAERDGRDPFPELEHQFDDAVHRGKAKWRGEIFRSLPSPSPASSARSAGENTGETEDVLLFFPSGAVCMDLDGHRTLGDGGKLYQFTVYSADRFLRGRFGSFLQKENEKK